MEKLDDKKIIALFESQQNTISAIQKQVNKIEEHAGKIENENQKNINLVKGAIGEIRHLPKDVEKGAQNALKDEINAYVDNLPNVTFKRLSDAVEKSQRDALEQNIKLEKEIKKARETNQEYANQIQSLSKKFYGLLIPALIATILNIASTFYNVTIVQNAISTANNIIESANSTIQQYNTTLNAAIPKIPEVAQTTGIEPWQAAVFSLLVIGAIVYCLIRNNR